MRRLIATVFLTCTLAACSSDLPQAPSSTLTATCTQHDLTDPLSVPECLLGRRTISQDDHDSAIALLTRARVMADSFRALGGTGAEFDNAARIDRALGLITSFQQRDLFSDSARFHRILDAVSVAMEVSSGSALVQGGVIRPGTTPHLLWYSYPGLGAFFQPVTTAQTVANLVPKTTVTNDSMLAVGQALYDYAIWREANGLRFPVWEYEFTWTSGGITNDAPWTSGMAQGLVMSIFADCYQRTGNPIWKDRAYEVLNSFKVNWADGGVRLADTTHGYWWEEFHPIVKVWNGSAQALIDVGYLWKVTNDPEVKRMFDRGIESLKYYTPQYDTGTWTIYSLTQGRNSVFYHQFEIELLDTLYDLSGDPWFKSTADRWRTYTPPPGVS